jgi:pimeloyl-ACP methyl ester carboxylesterase
MARDILIPLNSVTVGDGMPVLAVHGWTADHRLMSGCLEPIFAARPGFRRLYPDLPGMGETPASESLRSSDDMLDALDAFVRERLGDEPFLLIGESYGGYLARALAFRRREQVRGLALICPIGVAVDHADRHVPPRLVLRPDPELIAGLDAHTAEEFLDVAVVQNAETLHRFSTEILPALDIADRPALTRLRRRLTDEPETGEPFARPTLILTGRQDDWVGYADSYALLPHYPRATFAVLDVAGHNLQIEQPALFEALVGEWLDRVGAEM